MKRLGKGIVGVLWGAFLGGLFGVPLGYGWVEVLGATAVPTFTLRGEPREPAEPRPVVIDLPSPVVGDVSAPAELPVPREVAEPIPPAAPLADKGERGTNTDGPQVSRTFGRY